MKIKLIFIGLLISLSGFSQTIEELELHLRYTSLLKLDSVRHICSQIFKIDKYNELAVEFLMQSYRYQSGDIPFEVLPSAREMVDLDTTINYTDSIHIFFQQLVENDKLNPYPLILEAKYKYGRESSCSNKIVPLEKALQLDRNNIEVNYLLGEAYYSVFNDKICDNSKDKDLSKLASKCYDRLRATFVLDSTSRLVIQYPLTQLANYLGRSNELVDLNQYPFSSKLFFPIEDLGNFPENWSTDFELNVMEEVDLVLFLNRRYSEQLKAMNEPIMFAKYPINCAFRFTWLRTFHNPIAVRLENKDGRIFLIWKECDGSGGYEPGKIIENKQKELSKREWREFLQLIAKIDFWGMPSKLDEIPGCDGAQWILEGVYNGEYHVVDRWTPQGSDYANCCEFLLNLTGLRINEKELY